MIAKDEIDTKATEMGVHPVNIERDYVFGWLLFAFFNNAYLSKSLVFKGGNCMRKAYYPGTRFSGDLDFSTEEAIDIDRMLREINDCCKLANEASGVEFEIGKNKFVAGQMIDQNRRSYKGTVYFKDFQGEKSKFTISVLLDVTEFDRLVLPKISRSLNHPYSDANECKIDLPCVALEELLANKLKCLIQRRHSFDLYDLVYATFFDQSIEVDRSLVLKTFLNKTIFERSPGSAKRILLGLPMPFFKSALEKYIVCPVASRFDFDRISEGFRAALNSIFGEEDRNSWGIDPYFPAEYRNLIMDSGLNRKLMRLTYAGVQREIEPYALAYKRPRDEWPREYFYAYDRTGGRSSPPGIKTFLHQKIEELSGLDQSFEPRFAIELSKSGETPERAYFGGSLFTGGNRGRRRATTGRRRSNTNPFEQTFTIECPYCQKQFKRKKLNTKLNLHKDRNGYPCMGRTGYQVF